MTVQRLHILIFSPDTDLPERMTEHLTGGQVITGTHSEQQALQLISETLYTPNILFIDLDASPGFLDLVHDSQHTLLFVVAMSQDASTEARTHALQQGADCFLAKPVHLPEMLALIQRLGARISKLHPRCQTQWQLDPQQLLLTCPNGTTTHLTKNDLKLLNALADHPSGTTLSRQIIAQFMQREHAIGFDKTLNVMCGRLRKKVMTQCHVYLPLTSVRGEGIRFDASLIRVTSTEGHTHDRQPDRADRQQPAAD